LLKDGVAPSYYLEGLFYNVPKEKYVKSSFSETFCNGINWLQKTEREKLYCTNKQYKLLDESEMQWNASDCNAFLQAACNLWKEWR
jgi:hypothetical protein